MMTPSITALEIATEENFNLEGYLLANRDVDRHVKAGADGFEHFSQYGREEKRRQVSRALLDSRHGLPALNKFERFKSTVDTKRGQLRFLNGTGRFPVVMSDQHFSSDDYTADSANNSYGPFVTDIELNPDKLFMDLGCGVRDRVYPNCLYVEVYPSITADVIVGTDCTYPFKSNSFDGIGCFAVLEHTKKPWVVAKEIHRMLKPGGKCYIDYPFLQPVHGYPSHYYNATREGLLALFTEGFELDYCKTEASQGPGYTVGWILNGILGKLPEQDRERMMGMSVGELCRQAPNGPFWQDANRMLDDAAISEFACGNTLVATKTDSAASRRSRSLLSRIFG